MALEANPENLNPIPEVHVVEGENWLPKLSSNLHLCAWSVNHLARRKKKDGSSEGTLWRWEWDHVLISQKPDSPKAAYSPLPLCSTTKFASCSDSISIIFLFYLFLLWLQSKICSDSLGLFTSYVDSSTPFIAVFWLPWLNPPGLLDSNSKGMTFRTYEMAQKVKSINPNDWSLISRILMEEGDNCFQVVSFINCLKLDYLTRNNLCMFLQ